MADFMMKYVPSRRKKRIPTEKLVTRWIKEKLRSAA
jgi:hypothetical protein